MASFHLPVQIGGKRTFVVTFTLPHELEQDTVVVISFYYVCVAVSVSINSFVATSNEESVVRARAAWRKGLRDASM